MSKILNLKTNFADAQKYINKCKLCRKNIEVVTLAGKCGFVVSVSDYKSIIDSYNGISSETGYTIETGSRGMVRFSEGNQLIAVDENQSFEYKRFVAAYLLLSYMLNGQDSELYLDSYVDTELKSDIVDYTMDLLVPDEQLKAKLLKCDFDDLMIYFKVPDFVLRQKVLEYRKKASNNEIV